MKMVATSPIDFAEAIARADLAALVRGTCGEDRRGRSRCPFCPNPGSPTLTLTRDRKHWRCWSCGAKGDAIDWLVRRDGLTKQEAARGILGLPDVRSPSPRRGSPGPPHQPTNAVQQPATPSTSTESATSTPKPWRSAAWQEAVDALVADAEWRLWSPEGRAVLDWLRARVLADSTIRRFRLGYTPEGRRLRVEGREGSIWCDRGVLIPWAAPEGWYCPQPGPGAPPAPAYRWCGANVRRLPLDLGDPTPKPKYKAISGSERGYLYPFGDLTPGVPVLITEGEFDGLLGWQACGWIVNVATIGGSQQTPRPDALDALAAAPSWLVLPDADTAGEAALAKWEAIDPDRTVPVLLPGGPKDLTDFVRAGGDVLGWLAAQWRGLGWSLPRSLLPHTG